jgi:hypothetical protein
MVTLARFFDWRNALMIVQTRDLSQVASHGVPAVLAMEVAKAWPSLLAVKLAGNHSQIRARESYLGRGTNRRRTAC